MVQFQTYIVLRKSFISLKSGIIMAKFFKLSARGFSAMLCMFASTILLGSCGHQTDLPSPNTIQESLSTGPFSFQFPEAVTNVTLQPPKHIKASDGIDLAYYNFVPKKPKTIMVFYHGSGIWSNQLYQYMAQQLMKKHNLGTYLFDIRGHGHSQGPRGDAPSTEQVWQDISSAIDFVQEKHADCKIVLGGHSSGAGLVLNYANWHKHPAVSSYVFLAPFLGTRSGTLREHSNPENQFIKKVRLVPLLLHLVTKGYLFAHTPVIFFNYPEAEKQKDAHILEFYTNTMTQAITPNDPQALFAQLDKPFFLAIGACDEQFIPEKVIAFHEYAQQVKDNSVSQIIPEATHLSLLIDAPEIVKAFLISP